MTVYAPATAADDAALRALLRNNPMPGWAKMTMRREPDFFASLGRFGREWAVVAKDADDTIGMYLCADHTLHVNGQARRLGYLGGLRIAPRYRHRLRVLREGYATLRGMGHDFWYSSIAVDNRPARRLLEANLHDMPRYQPINELHTLLLPKARAKSHALWRPARPDEIPGICAFYNQQASHYHFAPMLTPDSAQGTGAHFHVIDGNDGPAAVMALWNQQHYKQVVATAYRQPLAALLPLYNGHARWTRRVCLPPPGQMLDQCYLSFLAVSPALEDKSIALIEDALTHCPGQVLTLGLHSEHGWLEPLTKHFRPVCYRTQIYTVSFDPPPVLDARPAQPEVALL